MGTVGVGGAGDFVLGRQPGEIFCLTRCVYTGPVPKILGILWRIQKWMKNTKKDSDPDPTSGLDPG